MERSVRCSVATILEAAQPTDAEASRTSFAWSGIGPPELIDQSTALPAFPRRVQLLGRLLGMQQFLRLRRRRRQIRVLGLR